MSNAALVNLWNYIQGMALSDRNKQWLADRLIESKSSSKGEKKALELEKNIEQGREEIRKGECVTCKSKEELHAFLENL